MSTTSLPRLVPSLAILLVASAAACASADDPRTGDTPSTARDGGTSSVSPSPSSSASSSPGSASTGSGAPGGSSSPSSPSSPSGSSSSNSPDGGASTAPSASGYLHVDGTDLKDAAGHVVRLTGVNWFGFETQARVVHGLWARDYKSMLKQMKAIGFNTVRIPWSNAILASGTPQGITTTGADPLDGTSPMNGDLAGKSPLEVLDAILRAAGDLGLRVILDHHSIKADNFLNEPLWYTSDFSEDQWIADWVTIARRYKNDPTVAAFDLDNEPHANATWGTGDAKTDWNLAAERCANAVLKENPDALILVEGVERTSDASYWWGGNLSSAKDHPIHLGDPSKLVYSPHEYGPEIYDQSWFTDPAFPSNLASLWDARFGFLVNDKRGPLLVGEFGIKDKAGANGRAFTWYTEFLKYMGTKMSWTFWSWNPDSGDTGGVLQDDWTHVNQFKIDAFKPYLAP